MSLRVIRLVLIAVLALCCLYVAVGTYCLIAGIDIGKVTLK